VHLAEGVEALRRSTVILDELAAGVEGVLLIRALGIVAVGDAQMNVEERSDAADRSA
jgi:hypothetical protein